MGRKTGERKEGKNRRKGRKKTQINAARQRQVSTGEWGGGRRLIDR